MVFLRSQHESKCFRLHSSDRSQQAVVSMVSTYPLIFNPSSPNTNLLLTIRNAPITICIFVTFIFQSLLVLLQGQGIYLSFRFPSVLLCGQTERIVHNLAIFKGFVFLLAVTRSGLLDKI